MKNSKQNATCESLFERFNQSKTATLLIYATTGIAFYLMNRWTPLCADDFTYMLTRGGDNNGAHHDVFPAFMRLAGPLHGSKRAVC